VVEDCSRIWRQKLEKAVCLLFGSVVVGVIIVYDNYLHQQITAATTAFGVVCLNTYFPGLLQIRPSSAMELL